jgi:hypothetical protein
MFFVVYFVLFLLLFYVFNIFIKFRYYNNLFYLFYLFLLFVFLDLTNSHKSVFFQCGYGCSLQRIWSRNSRARGGRLRFGFKRLTQQKQHCNFFFFFFFFAKDNNGNNEREEMIALASTAICAGLNNN